MKWNATILILQNIYENIIYEMSPILGRPKHFDLNWGTSNGGHISNLLKKYNNLFKNYW